MEKSENIFSWMRSIDVDINILLVAVWILIFFWFISIPLSSLIIKIFSSKDKKKIKAKDNPLYGTIKFLFRIVGVYVFIKILQLPVTINDILMKALRIISIIVIANGLAKIVENSSKLSRRLLKYRKDNININNIVIKTVKTIIYILAGFVVVLELGYDLSGIVTGLGLGSVVIALAAQDLAKNLISGIIILVEKPFKLGDWIEINGIEGNVEEIKFRTVRIRTSQGTLITIPNTDITSGKITDWDRNKFRRYDFNINLPLQVNEEKIDRIISRFKFVLEAQPNVIKNSVVINFTEIKDDAIRVSTYLKTDIIPYEDYLSFKTNINKVILNVLEGEEIKLSYPGRNVYIQENK